MIVIPGQSILLWGIIKTEAKTMQNNDKDTFN